MINKIPDGNSDLSASRQICQNSDKELSRLPTQFSNNFFPKSKNQGTFPQWVWDGTCLYATGIYIYIYTKTWFVIKVGVEKYMCQIGCVDSWSPHSSDRSGEFLQVLCPVIWPAWVLPHQSYVRKYRSYPLAPSSLLLTSSLIKALGLAGWDQPEGCWECAPSPMGDIPSLCSLIYSTHRPPALNNGPPLSEVDGEETRAGEITLHLHTQSAEIIEVRNHLCETDWSWSQSGGKVWECCSVWLTLSGRRALLESDSQLSTCSPLLSEGDKKQKRKRSSKQKFSQITSKSKLTAHTVAL